MPKYHADSGAVEMNADTSITLTMTALQLVVLVDAAHLTLASMHSMLGTTTFGMLSLGSGGTKIICEGAVTLGEAVHALESALSEVCEGAVREDAIEDLIGGKGEAPSE